MLNNSLAPIKRAALFFGFMGLAVTGLTLGAGLQGAADQSSTTVAEAKLRHNIPSDEQLASAGTVARVVSRAKQAIAASQQAMLDRPAGSVMR